MQTHTILSGTYYCACIHTKEHTHTLTVLSVTSLNKLSYRPFLLPAVIQFYKYMQSHTHTHTHARTHAHTHTHTHTRA